MVNHLSLASIHQYHRRIKQKKIKKRKEINTIKRERNQKQALKEQEQEILKNNEVSENQLSREAIEARDIFKQQTLQNQLKFQHDLIQFQQDIIKRSNIQYPLEEQYSKNIDQSQLDQNQNYSTQPTNDGQQYVSVNQKSQLNQSFQEKQALQTEVQKLKNLNNVQEFIERVEEINEFDLEDIGSPHDSLSSEQKFNPEIQKQQEISQNIIEQIKFQKQILRNNKNLAEKTHRNIQKNLQDAKDNLLCINQPKLQEAGKIKVPGYKFFQSKEQLEANIKQLNQIVESSTNIQEEVIFHQQPEILSGIFPIEQIIPNVNLPIQKKDVQLGKSMGKEDPFMKATLQIDFDYLKQRRQERLGNDQDDSQQKQDQIIQERNSKAIFQRDNENNNQINFNPSVIIKESTVKKSKIDLKSSSQPLLPPQLQKNIQIRNKLPIGQSIQSQNNSTKIGQKLNQSNQSKFLQLIDTNKKGGDQDILNKFFEEIKELK